MPIYEYQCNACGHRLEALQKISDKPLKKCPECGENQLKKLVSAAAFRLKGGGWYETDFKDKKAQKNLAKGDETPATASPDKKKDTSESKSSESSKTESKATESKSTETKSTKPAEKKTSKKTDD